MNMTCGPSRSRKRALADVEMEETEPSSTGSPPFLDPQPSSSRGKRLHRAAQCAPTPLHSPSLYPSDPTDGVTPYSLARLDECLHLVHARRGDSAVPESPSAASVPALSNTSRSDSCASLSTPAPTPSPLNAPSFQYGGGSHPFVMRSYAPPSGFDAHMSPPPRQSPPLSSSSMEVPMCFDYNYTPARAHALAPVPPPTAPATSPTSTHPSLPPPAAPVSSSPGARGGGVGKPKVTIGFVADCSLCLAHKPEHLMHVNYPQ